MKKSKKELIQTNLTDIFESKKTHYFMIALIVILLSVMFFRIGFLHYGYPAHDTQQWRWASQQSIDYNNTHSGTALWTDNLFSGMPTYQLQFPLKFFFTDDIFRQINKLISWRLMFLIFGALGMYILLIRQKFSPLIATFAALSFTLSCHFIGLIEIGHNTKYRAIMYLPWIFLAFEELRKKRSIFPLGLLSVFLISQLRENHFQISYYTFLMMGIYWTVYLIKNIKDKTLKSYFVFTCLLLAAVLISVIAVANPYLSTYEYTPYTIRGTAGLTTDYATSWSFGIWETLSFLVPYFFGGTLGTYWGAMPFTQTFMYMGIVVFFLAILAGVLLFRETKIKALVIICFVVLLISYGKHIPFLSNFLLSYLPLFNKFRVPAMILCIMQFAFPILAAYGLKTCVQRIKKNDILLQRTLLYGMLASAGLVVLFNLTDTLFSNMSFLRAEDIQRYQPAQLAQLKNMRMELFSNSGMQSFGILFGGLFLLWMMVKGYLKKNIVLILLIALSVFDLSLVNRAHHKEGTLVKNAHLLHEFVTTDTDRFLLEDQSLYRIYPFHEFANSRWSYYHQNIGGYHGAKLQRYQDVLDRNLYAELIAGIPINWNILDMLSVKYLIFNGRVDLPGHDVENVFREAIDRNTSYFVYHNKTALDRAWFVKDYEIITNRDRVSLRLNDPSWDPLDTVILETEVPSFYHHPRFQINMTHRDIHRTVWQTSNTEDAFMVVSEIYYPAGWNFYINGEKVPHYVANYILRGVHVPAGHNTIEMKFEPPAYKISIILSAIGIALALLLTIGGLVTYVKANYGKGIVYRVSS
jgi:hypothetical protein